MDFGNYEMQIGDDVDFETSKYTVPCPRCGAMSLGDYPDLPEHGEVECEECGAVFTCIIDRSWSGTLKEIKEVKE